MKFEIESTNPVVKALVEGTAPEPARLAASRGVLPLPQNDLFEVLIAFTASDDARFAENAKASLTELEEDVLLAAARSKDVPLSFLDYFARLTESSAPLHEAILLNPRTPASAIAIFASKTSNGSLLELVATN